MNSTTAVSNRSSAMIWILLSILVLGISLFDRLHHPLDINRDCAMYLQCGQLLLAGQIPYIDFFEVNPPLIMYLNILPAAIAQAMHWPLIIVFDWSVLLLAAVSLSLCSYILWRTVKAEDWRYAGPLLIGIALINLTVKEFGQREHLFVLAYLPFFLLRWWQVNGGKPASLLAVFIGLLAGVGVCLKPYFLIPVLLTEGYWLWKDRRFGDLIKPEVIAAVIVGIAYLVHFTLLPKGAGDSFYHYLVPLVQSGYDYLNCSFPPPLPMQKRVFLVFTVIPLAWLLRNRYSLFVPLLLWTAAGYLVYFSQQKGFVYQGIPMFTGIMLLAALEVGWLSTLKYGRWLAGAAGLALIVGLVGTDVWKVPENPYSYPGEQSGGELADVIQKESKPGDTVLFLSIPVQDPYPIFVQLDRKPGSRYLWLFPLAFYEQMKYKASTPAEKQSVQNLEDKFVAEIAQDIETKKPTLLFLWTGVFNTGDPGFGLYLPRYFHSQEPMKRALANYHLIGERNSKLIYKRNSAI
jgi:hypothetical protein